MEQVGSRGIPQPISNPSEQVSLPKKPESSKLANAIAMAIFAAGVCALYESARNSCHDNVFCCQSGFCVNYMIPLENIINNLFK